MVRLSFSFDRNHADCYSCSRRFRASTSACNAPSSATFRVGGTNRADFTHCGVKQDDVNIVVQFARPFRARLFECAASYRASRSLGSSYPDSVRSLKAIPPSAFSVAFGLVPINRQPDRRAFLS